MNSSEFKFEATCFIKTNETDEAMLNLANTAIGKPVYLHYDQQQPVGVIESARIDGDRIVIRGCLNENHYGDFCALGYKVLSFGYKNLEDSDTTIFEAETLCAGILDSEPDQGINLYTRIKQIEEDQEI